MEGGDIDTTDAATWMLPAPAAPPAPAPTTTSPDDRPPKHFAQWSAQVQAYEEKTVDGVKRVFPTEKLLGAEDVLARLWHEHTKTKEYKPLGLGEIVARRTWTAGMDLNTMAAGRSSSSSGAKAIKLIDGNLVTEDTDEWTPKGIMLTIDGIEASRWAWIICGFDEERRIDRFANWFIERARSKQASIPAVQSYWADSMWKLCADMRRGLTFGEATDRIMKDTGAWNEHVIAHAAAAARQRPAPPTKESMGPTGPPRPMVKSPGKAGRGAGGPRRRPTAQTTTKGDGRDGQQQPPKGQTKGGGRDDTGSWKDHGGRGGHQQKDWNAQAAQAYPTESPTATRSSCCPFSTVSARPPAGLGPRGQTGGHVRLGDGSGGQAVAKAQLPGLNDDDPATDVIEKVDPWAAASSSSPRRRHARTFPASPTGRDTTATAAGCSCRRWSSCRRSGGWWHHGALASSLRTSRWRQPTPSRSRKPWAQHRCGSTRPTSAGSGGHAFGGSRRTGRG